MSASIHMEADDLIHDLRIFCAQPSTSGKLYELEATARLIGDMIRHVGFDVRLVRTGQAPVIIGWHPGHRQQALLLYHHYDLPAPGPWQNWMHEPFQLAERNDNLYARGVALGKGPLIAHLHAIQTILQSEGELPQGIVLIVEGERLIGSPNLERVIKRYADQLHAQACLGTAGERDIEGKPFCYSGSKGLLQVQLSATGPAVPLDPALSASVYNPLWRLTWALGTIKGMDEDIRINGFYDSIDGPARNVRSILRNVKLDEGGRLAAWQLPEFLFGMSGSTLMRTEVTLPTCNLASLTIEPPFTVSSVPVTAVARLDFHLVPQQDPDTILDLLRKHLDEKGLKDVKLEKIPGGYYPVQCDIDHAFIQRIAAAGSKTYHAPLNILPFGVFTQPLNIFAHHMNIPVATVALSRHTSAEYGVDEHLPLDDLLNHGQMLIDLITNDEQIVTENENEVAVAE